MLDFLLAIFIARRLRDDPNAGLRVSRLGLAILLAIAVAAFVAVKLTGFLLAHGWISN